MPIVYPKTWSASEQLNASDVRSNIDAVQRGTHGLSLLEVSNTRFIDTKHIVQPTNNPYTKMMSGVSGVFGGQNSGSFYTKYSYLTHWLCGDSNNSAMQQIPHTAQTLNIMRPATVFYQFWACSLQPFDGNGTRGTGSLYFYVNNPNSRMGNRSVVWEQPDGSHASDTCNGSDTVNVIGIQTLNQRSLEYGIGITGNAYDGTYRFISWGVSFEVYYF